MIAPLIRWPNLLCHYIKIKDNEGEFPYNRLIQGTGNSIVGTWAVATTPTGENQREPIANATTSLRTQQFSFFADGTYVMLDPVGNDEGVFDTPPETCGTPGVEAGKYNFTNGKITFSDMIVDTNDCAGMHGDDGYDEPISAEISCNTMTWDLGYNIPFVLERIDRNEGCIDNTDIVSFKDIAGVYYHNNYDSVLRINSDGSYIVGDLANSEGTEGLQSGTFDWNPLTGVVTPTINSFTGDDEDDNRIGIGFRYTIELRFSLNNDQLKISDVDIEIDPNTGEEIRVTVSDTFNRLVQGAGDSIVGVWAVANKPVSYDSASDKYVRKHIADAAENLDLIQFVFFANGKYAMLDPIGDDEGVLSGDVCGQKGVELGEYTLDNGVLTFKNNLTDTNGCAGMHTPTEEVETNIEFTIEGDIMTWAIDNLAEDSDPFELKRINTQILN